MGDPRKPRKKYRRPYKPWNKALLEETNRLAGYYGLRNKRELWRAEAMARKYRRMVRSLLAAHPEEAARIMRPVMEKLARLGVVGRDAHIDDLLSLSAKDFLERRLQTVVWRRGFAKTPYQARQMIVHGHIRIAGRRIRQPGYLVTVEEEDQIECTHPECLQREEAVEASSGE